MMMEPQKTLYDYQKVGIVTLRERKRMMLCDDVGLGKTVQAVGALTFPALIIAPSRAIGTWRQTLTEWIGLADGEEIFVYRGTPKKRAEIAYDFKQLKGRKVLIATYQMMGEIQNKISARWKTIVFDESHILRNRQSYNKIRSGKSKGTLHPTAKQFSSERMYLLTASPVVNGAKDWWTQLNLIDSKNFRSYWNFVNRYANVHSDGFSTQVEGTNQEHAEELHKLLRPYVLMRTVSDVGLELPDLTRQFVPLEMSDQQRLAYDRLSYESMLLLENNKFILTPNMLAKFTRLRQLLVCPRLLSIADDGIALQTLQAELETMIDNIVVFTPFREALPYIAQAIENAGYNANHIYTIAGGMDETRIEYVRQQFLARPNRAALIATLQSGTSWSVPGIRLCYTIGFEWVPMWHEQAEGRLAGGLRRTVPVLSKYLIHERTIDAHMMRIIQNKITWRDLATRSQDLFQPKG